MAFIETRCWALVEHRSMQKLNDENSKTEDSCNDWAATLGTNI